MFRAFWDGRILLRITTMVGEFPPGGEWSRFYYCPDIASILEWVFDAIYQTTSIFQFIVMFLLQIFNPKTMLKHHPFNFPEVQLY